MLIKSVGRNKLSENLSCESLMGKVNKFNLKRLEYVSLQIKIIKGVVKILKSFVVSIEFLYRKM